MPNRATEAEVLELLDTTLTAEDLTPFCRAANNIVSGNCLNVGYSTEDLTLIEMWLAAHLTCSKDPLITKEKTGEAAWTFGGKTGLGLDSTSYGQQVKLLDRHKTLALLDSSKGSAEFKALL